MNLLAFDPGSSETGWAWLDVRGGLLESKTRPPPIVVTYVDCGNIASTHSAIGDFLRRNKPDMVAVEKVEGHAFNKKRANRETGEEELAPMPVKYLIASAAVGGGIAWLAQEHTLSLVEMSALQWRRMVCGKGGSKDAMIKLAVERFIVNWPARSNTHNRDAGGLGLAAAWSSTRGRSV